MTKRNPRNRPGPSSQDHRKLFEDAHDAILIFSLEDETVLDVNARACEIYGFSRREFIGKSIKAISKDPKRGESHLKKTLLARTKHSFESTQFRKDGSEMCLAISASVIDHHGGKVILSINRDITQQKQAQDALEESERRYRSVVDVLAEGIVLQNASGEIEACNASAEAILGLTKSQMMGRSSLDPRWRAIRADGSPFPGDEHPAMKALKSGKPVTGEIMGVYKPDGTLTWISINSQPMFQRQGEKPYAAVTSFHDITDQMETRRQLYQNEKRYRSLYRNTPAMLHSCGPDGRIVEVSDTWLSTLGYARSEVLGKAPGAFYTDASKAFIEQVARPALVKAGRVDDIAVTAKKRNGDLVEALLSSVVEYDDRGDVVRTHSVMVDVTEKHDALNRLKEQSEFLRQVVDTNPNLIFAKDEQGRFTLANKAVAQIYGTTVDNLLGKTDADFNPSQKEVAQFIDDDRKVIRSGKPKYIPEEKVTGAAGEERWFQTIKVPLGSSQGLRQLLGVATDITQRKEAERQLKRANEYLQLAYDTTLEGWVKALDLRDKETENHTQRVTDMTLRLARALGLEQEGLVHLRRGALLHDIGKMAIPDSVLLKAGPLDEEEWAIMRKHPVYAYEWLKTIDYLKPALEIPYCHHEKWDGTGYPRGLKGEEIPLAARIFAVADVWDALGSDRPYRKAWTPERVLTYVGEQAGSHFDPEVVGTFLEISRK